MSTETTGNGRRVPGGTVWLFTPADKTPLEQRAALTDWARENHLDPSRVIGSDGVEVDLVDQVIRYQEVAAPGDPGAYPGGGNSVWKRRAVAPLLVEPPAVLRRPPVGYVHAASVVISSPTPPAAYDWARYKRTCDPDRQLDGLGDLCLFLGGSWSETPGASSFTGELLKLIAKADRTRLAALEAGFPREVRAWLVWMPMSPTPTAAELCARLVDGDNKRRVLLALADATTLAPYVLNDDDIWGPEVER